MSVPAAAVGDAGRRARAMVVRVRVPGPFLPGTGRRDTPTATTRWVPFRPRACSRWWWGGSAMAASPRRKERGSISPRRWTPGPHSWWSSGTVALPVILDLVGDGHPGLGSSPSAIPGLSSTASTRRSSIRKWRWWSARKWRRPSGAGRDVGARAAGSATTWAITLVVPPAPLVALGSVSSASIRDVLLATAIAINPFIENRSRHGLPGEHHASAEARHPGGFAMYVGAQGATAAARPCPQPIALTQTPLGAGLGACLAAADLLAPVVSGSAWIFMGLPDGDSARVTRLKPPAGSRRAGSTLETCWSLAPVLLAHACCTGCERSASWGRGMSWMVHDQAPQHQPIPRVHGGRCRLAHAEPSSEGRACGQPDRRHPPHVQLVHEWIESHPKSRPDPALPARGRVDPGVRHRTASGEPILLSATTSPTRQICTGRSRGVTTAWTAGLPDATLPKFVVLDGPGTDQRGNIHRRCTSVPLRDSGLAPGRRCLSPAPGRGRSA